MFNPPNSGPNSTGQTVGHSASYARKCNALLHKQNASQPSRVCLTNPARFATTWGVGKVEKLQRYIKNDAAFATKVRKILPL
jgi:hypothetical protein